MKLSDHKILGISLTSQAVYMFCQSFAPWYVYLAHYWANGRDCQATVYTFVIRNIGLLLNKCDYIIIYGERSYYVRCEIFTVALMRGIERAWDGRGRGMRKLWKRTETRKVVWLENLKERDGSKCIGVNCCVHGNELLCYVKCGQREAKAKLKGP